MSLQEIHLLKKFLEDDADSFHDGDAISVDDLIESIEVHNQSAQRPVFHPEPSHISSDEVSSLRRKFDRLQREKDDDQDFYNAKIR